MPSGSSKYSVSTSQGHSPVVIEDDGVRLQPPHESVNLLVGNLWWPVSHVYPSNAREESHRNWSDSSVELGR